MSSQSRRKRHVVDDYDEPMERGLKSTPSTSRARRNRQVVDDHDDDEPMDEGEQWSPKHKLLLQCLIHSRMVTKMELSQVHGKLFNDSESLHDSLKVLTKKIDKLKMDIKEVKFDITGETYYVIVHTTGESFYPRCCIFSKPQLDFLKKILTSIVLSNNGMIGKIDALNSCRGMSKSDADEALLLFEDEKILMELSKGGICLTPLAVVEFAPFFHTCFSDNLSTCDLCKQLVFVGRACEKDTCGLKYHHHCAAKWLVKRSDCPGCGSEWTVDMQADTE